MGVYGDKCDIVGRYGRREMIRDKCNLRTIRGQEGKKDWNIKARTL